MNPTKLAGLRRSVAKFCLQFAQHPNDALSSALPAKVVEALIRQAYPNGWRERVYGPLTTLKLFIGQALCSDPACMDAVSRCLSERLVLAQGECSLNTGPYCKARQRLPIEIPQTLLEVLGRRLEAALPAAWCWRDRRVKLFDATTVSMPDTPSNQRAYSQSCEQKPGLGFPVARIGALMSLGSGAVLGYEVAACKGKGTGESTLFRKLYRHLAPRDIVLADALHCTWWTIAALGAAGADILMAQNGNRTTDFARGRRLGPQDHLIDWPRLQRPAWMSVEAYDALPERLWVREIQIGNQVLVTTLTDARAVRPQELRALYAMRWNIEVDFRTLKVMMGMDVLRCQSQDMIDKEIAVYLLAYNLVRAAMAQAARLCELLPRALSFVGAKRSLALLEQHLRHHPDRRRRHLHVMHAILRLIARCRLPHRPHRVEPRAKKRRPKPLPLLTTPRTLARQAILAQRTLKVAP